MLYEYNRVVELGGGLLTRLDSFFSKKRSSGLIRKHEGNEVSIVEYYVRDYLQSSESQEEFRITFEIISGAAIQKTIIDVPDSPYINEYHLRAYISELYTELLLRERGGDHQKYVVRVYAKYFNSKRIQGEFLVNTDFKTLIKSPAQSFPDKQEPLSEHVIFYDSEINAINIEHARSLAYNNARNINAALSLLLDVEFELIDSEFRNFIIKKEEKLSLSRFRTGFIDLELGLIVKDNLNGLKSINDQEDLDSFMSGEVFFELIEPVQEGVRNIHHFSFTEKKGVEITFVEHSILRNKAQNTVYRDAIKRDSHYPNEEILVPRCIRNYFNGIKKLPVEKREAFFGCAHLYNLALILSRREPTAAASYLVCAVEVLAKFQKISFSQLVENSLTAGYDKKLCDYFYGGVRSSHFHSGRFVFNENNTSLLTAIDIEFQEKIRMYREFYNMARECLIFWVEGEILKPDL